MKIALHIAFFSLLVCACIGETGTILAKKWLGDTNLVATVAGYQVMREIANGVEIPVFTVNGEKSGDETGVLFYVVAPTNYVGLYFWMHHDGLMASGYLTSLYKTNTLYYFPFYPVHRSEVDNGVLHADTLFDFNRKGKGSPCTLKPLGWPYFASRREAESTLAELRRGQARAEEAIVLARTRLNNADKPPPPPKRGEPRGLTTSEKLRKYAEYFAALSELQNLEAQVSSRSHAIEDAQKQLDKLQSEAQPGDTPNPHSPSDQGAGGR